MDDTDHATRMSTLRRELEQERSEGHTLRERVADLEAQVEALQAIPPDGNELEATKDLLEGDDSPSTDQGAPAEPISLSEEKGLPHLTSLYGTALQDSKNIQKVSLEKPTKFTGLELEEDPYSLTYWYRDVLCWCQAYAFDRPKEQLVLAISQALGGTAKSMVQNLIMKDPDALQSVEDLYSYLKKTFQNQDPGPEAWREFHTTRMRRSENVLQFLNRLVQLSFVVNASSSPVCRTLSEHDISARLQHGLPAYLQKALYKHLEHLIDVDKVPDMEPGNLAATIFKLEREAAEPTRKDIKQPDEKWRGRSPANREYRPTLQRAAYRPVAIAAAMPTQQQQTARSNGYPKRQHKRFDDLEEEQKNAIIKVQTQLASKPLGGKLTLEEKNLCLAHALCQRCRRYGHDQSVCKMASVMGAPKN